MSFSAYCFIYLKSRPPSYVALLRALMESGWATDLVGGATHYETRAADGLLALHKRRAADIVSMFDALNQAEAKDETFGMRLRWHASDRQRSDGFDMLDE